MFHLLKTYREFDCETFDTIGQGRLYEADDLGLKDLLRMLSDVGHTQMQVLRAPKDGRITRIDLLSLDAEIDYTDGSHRHTFVEIEGPARALARLPKLIKLWE